MARTTAIGLRRDPQPPMPMVMPERSSDTISSTVVRLSATLLPFWPPPSAGGAPVVVDHCLSLLDEGRPLLVGDPPHVQLVGEPLLEPVAPLHVDRVDAVHRLLRPTDDRGA